MTESLADTHDTHDTHLPPSISTLVSFARRVRYAQGCLVLREGEAGDCLYILLTGRIRIFVDADNERRFVIGSYGPGAIFGEGSLDGGPRTASVEAISEIQCAVLSYDELREKLAADARFATALTMELIGRSRTTARRLKGLALGTVYERFRELVEQEALVKEGVRQLPGEWSHKEIANRIGSSRDMVTKILKELGKGDYVAVSRGHIAILRDLPKRW